MLVALNVVEVFEMIRNLLGKLPPISTDNVVFQLHYKMTVLLLLASSVLITSREYYGNPVVCHFPKYPHSSLNDYCAAQSSLILQRSITSTVGKNISHPELSGSRRDNDQKLYRYYRWIFLALFVQAMFFYAPRYVWKVWEGGKMNMLTTELISPVLTKEGIEKNAKVLVDYFCMHLHLHNDYAYKYYTCELLNLINVTSQICFINVFFGGLEFYGMYIKFLTQQPDDNVPNPIEWIFPTITKCTFSRYGASGSIEKLDGICVLTQNPANEKICISLWFWFHILAIVSLLMVIYRIAILNLPSFRLFLFRSFSLNCSKEINTVHNQLWIGDWFLLHRLEKNLNPLVYKELISRIADLYGDERGDESGIWYIESVLHV